MNLERVETLRRLLKIRGTLPLIQSPMAGASGVKLVKAVCESGHVGSIGAGYMDPNDLRALLKTVKGQLDSDAYKSLNVNLMVPPRDLHQDQESVRKMIDHLTPIYNDLSIATPSIPVVDLESMFLSNVDVLIEESVPIASFTFGVPDHNTIAKLKDSGIVIIGTATSLDEAFVLQSLGFDAVVAQGTDAGGHQGTFLPHSNPLKAVDLVRILSPQLTVPVICAGGVMTGRDIACALRAGAAGVQIGTAFLTTHECEASETYKNALLTSTASTTLTKTFTGKYARAVKNTFIEYFPDDMNIPEFPLQSYLTSAIRKAGLSQGNSDLLSLWAGERYRMCRRESVHDLLRRLIDEFIACNEEDNSSV